MYRTLKDYNNCNENMYDSCSRLASGQNRGQQRATGSVATCIVDNSRVSHTRDLESSFPFNNPFSELEQPIIYDRQIFVNKQSRGRGFGDPIRGDLPIIPRGGDLWRVSADPQIDLRQGAVDIIAGENNQTQKDLQALQMRYGRDIRNQNGDIAVLNTPY